MDFEENYLQRYQRLNQEQKKAVDTIEGPVMVIAGPGSGKTELLSLRVANIIRQADVNASNILCLTFTDAAAVNMRDRLSQLIGQEAYRVAIHTFHSFGQKIIEDNPTSFFGGAKFAAVDELVQYEVLNEILRELPNDSLLSSYHSDQGYVYLYDVKSSISNLKRAAITPVQFKQCLQENSEFYKVVAEVVAKIGAERVSIKRLDSWQELLKQLEIARDTVKWSSDYYPHPALSLFKSVDRSITKALEEEKTSSLSQWKRDHITKTDTGHVLKDQDHLAKQFELADIFEQYETRLHDQGYFDFDDMLSAVVERLQADESLLYEVSEQYQYILIDEFQDTNDAQLKLALTVARPELFEGRPNLMAVGDDDQAINRFQGADISNISIFTNQLRDTQFITLTKNYRSHSDIIDLAKKVIRQGEDRLENTVAEIDKELVAANESITDVDITFSELPSRAHEYSFIASRIKELISEGFNPSDIAVLGRKHAHLQALVTHLHAAGVPVRYERNLDVLTQKHVRELILMSRYIQSLANKDVDVADQLLPQILSFEFWQLDRLSVWKLGQVAYQNRISWHEAMAASDNEKLNIIANFFASLSEVSHHEPMEIILDHLIGAQTGLLRYDDSDEYDTQYRPKVIIPNWHSPFKEFYFATDLQNSNRSLYISFLSNLRVFVSALREYRQNEITTIHDLVEFVELHEQYGRLVADTSSFVSAEESVHVMTAHKSKGLEFEVVFVVNAVDEVWATTRNASKLRFPLNLPIEPAGTTNDDNLRLFFVAITRAKSRLYLTSYTHDDKGKDINQVRYTAGLIDTETTEVDLEPVDILQAEMHVWHALPPSPDESAYLKELVKNYQLSVTHLNTFLDVSRGGPQTWFEQNLLRFPQAKTPASAFGSVIHGCIEHWYRIYKDSRHMPGKAILIECFDKALKKERLASYEINKLRDRGHRSLEVFYDHLANSSNIDDVVEKNFKHEGVRIGEMTLTGKIDKISIDKAAKTAVVSDYKTGEAIDEWKTSGQKAIKLHNYRRQLIFYRLLLNESNSYSNVEVVGGELIFVEPDKNDEILSLTTPITDEEVARLRQLIAAVGQKIKNLELPDISNYPQTIKGIIKFEDDLIDEYGH